MHSSIDLSIPESVLQPLFTFSKSSNLNEALEILIEDSRDADVRAQLAERSIIHTVLSLIQYLPFSSSKDSVLLSLKFLRNLCAGERANQDSFIDQNGLEIISTILYASIDEPHHGILRTGLQTLANVVFAGKKYQLAVWYHFFPEGFTRITKIKSKGTCDPLCLIIFITLDGNKELIAELCGVSGLSIVSRIVHITSAVGFDEDWLMLLLSKICLQESYFPPLFLKLHKPMQKEYTSEHAFLLSIISGILNEEIIEISNDFGLYVLQILQKSVEIVDFSLACESGLPTGTPIIDVLGYSLTILRDICANNNGSNNSMIVNSLISNGLIELLLCFLRDLDLPSLIKKTQKDFMNFKSPSMLCLYRGFRRDIVAVIGNCVYHRKHAQDKIRETNGILLMLQQCVVDESNPFLREWGIWSVRNLLEGNTENQKVVAELELRCTIDVPEISALGLHIEVDKKTRHPKLVNS